MKKIIFVVCLFLVFISFGWGSMKKRAGLEMSLQNCMLHALNNNLDIAVASFDPEISNVSIRQAGEKYYPQLSLNYFTTNQTVPSTWGLEGNEYKSKYDYMSFGLSQSIKTGGTLNFMLYNRASDTTRAFTNVNPSYFNEISLEFNQPLLKGFGKKISDYELLKAKNAKQIAVYGVRSTIQQKVYEIEEAYWNLVYQRENLKVQRLSLKQNEVQLKKARQAARMGIKSSIDVLQMETEQARWEDGVLNAQSLVEVYEDRLKSIMNIKPGGLEVENPIIPTEKPGLKENTLSYERAFEIALENRPETASLLKKLENNRLDISYSKNQLLPQVDFNLKLWFPGQSGERLVYLDNNPLTGIIVNKIVGSRWDSFRESWDRKYQNWQVSLNFNIPVANIFSRANLVKAQLEKDKYTLELKKTKRDIENELTQVFKELRNKAKRITSTSRYRMMAEKQLDAATQRYELGLESSSQWLLEYQRRLSTAKVEEFKALVDYKIAMAKLEKITGTNLMSHNLKYKKF